MKYSYHTLNTGHTSRHDSDVDVADYAAAAVRPILDAGGGPIPGTRATCQFAAEERHAVLSVSLDGYPLWVAHFHLDQPTAARALALLRETFGQFLPDWPSRLPTPGIATLLLPPLALAPPADVLLLADFAKVAFVSWATSTTVHATPQI